MDNLSCNNNNKSPPALRKVKKKQGKDEMDRLKQAEKKKRRLEKALATSAAIRSELEKKKQKKKEEQQRLDEEGAAIAEAVALHVLLGEEDTDDKFEGATAWNDHADFLMRGRHESVLPREGSPKCSLEGIGWISNTHASVLRLSGGFGGGDFTDLPCPSGPYVEEGYGWSRTELCPGLIAAQAVSSLQIRDDANLNTIFVDEVLRG